MKWAIGSEKIRERSLYPKDLWIGSKNHPGIEDGTTMMAIQRMAGIQLIRVYPIILLTADGNIGKPQIPHLLRVEQISSIEYDGRSHQLLHPLEIGPPELRPIGNDEQGINALETVVAPLACSD